MGRYYGAEGIRVGNINILAGDVSPEGTKTAGPGSFYHRSDGTIWIKRSGTGNTGWVESTPVVKSATQLTDQGVIWFDTSGA